MCRTEGSALELASGEGQPSHGKGARVVVLDRVPDERDLMLKVKRLDLSLLPEGILADLHAYWREKAVGGRLPARADIDPLDLSWALGRLCLLEVSRSPLLFRYRLDGSMIAAHRGWDMTGRTTDEARPLALANILREQYCQILQTAAPNFFEIHCSRDMICASFSLLALPLAADGAQVDMILTCALGTEAMLAFSCTGVERAPTALR